VIRLVWGLAVLTAASVVGAAVIADLLVHSPSSLILRTLRHWSDIRYARKWGLSVELLGESVQAHVAAEIRCDAVNRFGVSDQQWREFCNAHPLTQVGGAS
jgi:hypothetical protein